MSLNHFIDKLDWDEKTKIELKHIKRRDGDPPVLVANNSKAFDILGWKPQHSEIENIIRSAKDFEYSQDYFIQEFGQNKEKTL